jgi:hypothetical protein
MWSQCPLVIYYERIVSFSVLINTLLKQIVGGSNFVPL